MKTSIGKRILSMGVVFSIMCGIIVGTSFDRASGAGSLEVYGLACEYNENPEAVDRENPLLSWKLSSNERGVKQEKYRIVVSTSPEKLSQNDYDVWDSGEVSSSETTAIEYGGATEAAKDYYWQVFVWDNKGNTAASETAKFGMGLISESDWSGAEWISNIEHYSGEANYVVEMDFNLEGDSEGRQTAASIIFGAQGDNTYYMYQIASKDAGLLVKPHIRISGEWREYTNPTEVPENAVASADRFDTWHTFRAEYNNGTITAYINDVEIDERSFSSNLGKGRIGFRSILDNSANERAKYRNIKITEDGRIVYNPDFTETGMSEFYSVAGEGNISAEGGVLSYYATGRDAEFITLQRAVAEGGDGSKYTFEHEFQLVKSATGIIFGAVDEQNFYMWQIKEGYGTGAGKMFLRPHIWSDGNPSVMGGDLDITAALPWEERFEKHIMTIEADNGTFKTYIDGTLVDTRSDMLYKDPGFIGIRASLRAEDNNGEEAYYDNIKLTLDDGTVIFSEDFSAPQTSNFVEGQLVDGRLLVKYDGFDFITWQERDFDLPYLRKDFDTQNKEITRAKIFASALGVYEAYINGERVGDDYLAPGWTDYDKRVPYQAYDVTDMVKSGQTNIVGARLSPGWYSGKLGIAGGREHYGKGVSFIAKLLIEYADGSTDTIVTDNSWKFTNDTPLTFSDIIDGETYNALKQIGSSPNAWATDEISISDWENVFINKTNRNLEANIDPPIEVTDIIEPVDMWRLDNGSYIIDFGQNFAGVVEITVKGNPGDIVVLKHGEVINKDKTVYYENLRQAKATDKYIIRTNEEETFMPSFTFHGFRYAEVQGVEDFEMSDIKGMAIGSNLPITSTFESSNPMVNQLYSNILWSQKGNYLSVPTDCPQRDERRGWTGDAEVFVRTGSYNMDSMSFYTKFLQDIRDTQRADGAYGVIAPNRGFELYGATAWGDAGVIAVWTMYHQYGDTRIIEENFEAMEAWVGYYKGLTNNYINFNSSDLTMYGDWLNVNEETDKNLIATAFFAYCAELVAEMADVMAEKTGLEKYEESAAYHKALREDIKQAYIARYVASDGSCGNGTQGSYVLSLAFDLVPDELKQAAADKLVTRINQRGGVLTTGFVTVGRLCPVLTEYGYSDVAYKLLTNTKYPSWGYSIDRGATTIWERWNSCLDDGTIDTTMNHMNSLNHYSFGAIGEWMFADSLGIDWDKSAAGFDNFVLAPNPINDSSIQMTYANGTYESIRGNIASGWSYAADGTLVYKATVPANTTATLYLPVTEGANVTESGVSAEQAEGVTFVAREGGKMVYTLGSGEYEFRQTAVSGGQSSGQTSSGTSASSGTQEPPVSSETQEPPVSSGTQEPPVSSGTQEPPVSSETQDPPVSSETQDPPVSSETQEPPVSSESNTSEESKTDTSEVNSEQKQGTSSVKTEASSKSTGNPKTGDGNMVFFAITALGLSGLTVVFVKRRNRR